MWKQGQRVVDRRYSVGATVYRDVETSHHGSDGYPVVVIYDDEPDTIVGTGSDYFEVLADEEESCR